MKQFFLTVTLFSLFHSIVVAQPKTDSLFLSVKDGRAYVPHEIRKGETLFGLAQQYNVPAVVLAQTNDLSFHETPVAGRILLVPLGKYNFLKNQPQALSKAVPLYYRVKPGESWDMLGAAMDVSVAILRSNNPGELSAGSALLSGWLLYEPPVPVAAVSNTEKAVSSAPVVYTVPGGTAVSPEKKDVPQTPRSEHELMYNYQTNDGTDMDSSSGMVVFFQAQTTVSEGRLYAFSNDLPKGRVVKILNPSNGKYAFARILGPIPGTKQYHNAKIGVDNRAKKELGIREDKLWCNLYYNF